ncbi:MAG: serine/threonine-protein kinase RsbW [Actinomycetota bacterium]|nr:serine/threonine-protein kinase RsbW [Actinomycetota bacterium]
MQILFTVVLPRDEVTVPLIRHIVRDSLLKIGATRDCVGDIELALTEACSNVLHHAKTNPSEYQVTVDVDDGSCDIKITDAGTGFDAAKVAVAGDLAESGRGITLMKALVDDLKFVSNDRGTVVHLAKRLELTSDSLLVELARKASQTA